MRLKTRVEELESNTRVSFDGVSCDMDTIIEVLQSISNRLAELEDVYGEIATNGVVRDLRRLEKEHEVVMNAVQGLRGHVDDKFDELDRNGVAAAVNKLNDEVFKSRKEAEYSWSNHFMRVHYGIAPAKQEEPTLAGKVDAIIEHLGLDLSVKPAEKKEAKVVAKKVTKKKGKK